MLTPNKAIVWLGFKIDANEMRVTIPQCQTWTHRKKTSRKDLHRLAGCLNQVVNCVSPAIRFMARIFTALRAAPFTGKREVPDNLKADKKWFLEFAERSNG